MRRAVVLAFLGSLALAGAAFAYPYTPTTDVYTVTPAITPFHSGTSANPQPADFQFAYDVDTTPSGARPGLTKTVKISLQGMGENSGLFAACSYSKLVASGPSACPKGSKMGSGFVALEEGPGAGTNTNYDSYCSLDETMYNSGHHSLLVYITEGLGEGDYDPCVLPGDKPLVTTATLTRSSISGVPFLSAVYTFPYAVLHPSAGTDAAIVHEEWEIPTATAAYKVVTTVKVVKVTFKHKWVGKGKKRHRITIKVTKVTFKKVTKVRRAGFIDTRFCPASGQRALAAGFIDEDATAHLVTASTPCSA